MPSKPTQTVLFNDISSSAIISECGKYRYSLSRVWDESKVKVMFIMLNPSTADSTVDDPTIRRCIGFAKQWGYGGIHVCNLFAYRATNPKELLKVDNPLGDENSMYIEQMSNEVDLIICAWGNYSIVNKLLKYGKSPENILAFCTHKLYCIDKSILGFPKHPLYLKSELNPKKYVF